MPSIGIAKTRAKMLRDELSDLGHNISQSQSPELVSKIHGFRNWNTLNAIMSHDMPLMPTPNGWLIAGDQKQDFEVGTDPNIKHNNAHPAIIRSTKAEPIMGFATLMQQIKADAYRGQRVRLTAELMSLDCKGAVTIWLRADGPDRGKILAFDNMETRNGDDGPLTGTTDWTERHVVLDIPPESVSLNFGFYLRGNGAAWASNFKIESVDHDVNVTGGEHTQMHDKPINLNFS